MAVGLGPGDQLGGDGAARAAKGLDHYGLAEALLELFGRRAGEDVAAGRRSVPGEAAGGEGDDEAHRAGGRPGLGVGGGEGEERGGGSAPGERRAVRHGGSSRSAAVKHHSPPAGAPGDRQALPSSTPNSVEEFRIE